jgi:hypothetical protein
MVKGWGSQQFLKYLGTSCLREDGTTPYGYDLHNHLMLLDTRNKNVYSFGVENSTVFKI